MSQGKLTSSLLFSVIAAATGAACVETDDDLDLGTEAQALKGGCGSWGCDSNSPLINAWDFHELEENGLANDAGVRLLRLVKGSTAYRVDVQGAKLFAYPLGSGAPLSGTALVNSYLEVATPGGTYRIYIKSVSNVAKFWVGNPTPIETYDLAYTNQTSMTDLRPLCKNAPGRLDAEGQWWLKPLEATIFTGDRYTSETLEVTAASYAAAGSWFNIGCAGGALAKLHFTRHTTAGADSSHPSTKDTRQAMLKMYTADICGNGWSSTQQGEPLVWQNKYGWDTLPAGVASIEGLWNEDGAICIDEHRLQNDPVLWSSVQADIAYACSLVAKPVPPTCSSLFPGGVMSFPGGSYLVSANP